jgi:aspartyl-tRNA(Asn)/glutamyl-tRNA(Gln) amidotransferase subunit B
MKSPYEAVIGLEIHVQLKTRTKMFCGCSTAFGAAPNTQTCPVCLGLPGALPVLNGRALELALRTALALGCRIHRKTKFDRKQYFYPDLPKNYQISQYDLPLAVEGSVPWREEDRKRNTGLIRIHMEEDAGKLLHGAPGEPTRADLNRAGIPLLEIVSRPELHRPEDAHAFLEALKQILRYLEVSDCEMQEGSLRCDVNVSLRPPETKTLGARTEIKNLNSFKGVQQALDFEIRRQGELLAQGAIVPQETRTWDAGRGITEPLRSKEGVEDYRYFPDPDLPPLVLAEEQLDSIRALLPELPDRRRVRFVESFGLTSYDAVVLTSDKPTADFFERCCSLLKEPKDTPSLQTYAKKICNRITGMMLRYCNEHNIDTDQCTTPENLVRAVELEMGTPTEKPLGSTMAGQIFFKVLETGKSPDQIIQEEGLRRIEDDQTLSPVIQQVLAEQSKAVADYRGGKKSALSFLVGQAMRLCRGQAQPDRLRLLLQQALEKS